MSNTRKFIKDYCAKNNLSPTALEKKAGLSKDAIYSFLIGKVSDLKLSNAAKLADTIGCSLEELAGRKTKAVLLYSTHTNLNKQLLKESLDFVLKYIDQHSIADTSLAETFSVVDAIYDYSHKNGKDLPDTTFGNWFCQNAFNKLKQ